jgi:hypothetical protein
MKDDKRSLAETLFRQHGPILKADFLRKHGFYSRALAELMRDGFAQKLKTGYYIWNTATADASDIETAAALVPFGIVCLQSAAVLHELTMLNPLAVTIAIPANRTRVALPSSPPQAAVIETALAGINPLNAGKKKDELIPLIKRFIPGVEDYLAVVRRYKGEFERQERVNAFLKKEVEDSKVGIKERLEAQQLRQNYGRLKAIYNAIPEDIRREAAAEVNHQRQRPQYDGKKSL